MALGQQGGASFAAAVAGAVVGVALLALYAKPAAGAYAGAAPIMLQFDRRAARSVAFDRAALFATPGSAPGPPPDAPPSATPSATPGATPSNPPSEEVQSGDRVFLRAHTGNLVKVTGYGTVEATAAQHPDEAEYLTIERVAGNGTLMAGDAVYFNAWTEKRLSVTPGKVVVANWTNRGVWERLTVQKKQGGGPIRFNDTIYLLAWTKTYIDADGNPRDSVLARYNDMGLWQSLRIEKASKPSTETDTPTEVGVPRTTLDGCSCQRVWRYKGDRCTDSCCNPDQDPQGAWCFTESSAMCTSQWGYCAPPPAVTTTTMPTGTTQTLPAHRPPVPIPAPAWEHFQLVNEVRRRGYTCPGGATFPPSTADLAFDCRLAIVAFEHCKDMIAYDYLDTVSPRDGSTPSSRARELGVEALAESVAAYTLDANTTLQLFLGSQPHCEVLMNPRWTTMGVGYATGGIYRRYWTQLFGASDLPEVDAECYRRAVMLEVAAKEATGVLGDLWQAPPERRPTSAMPGSHDGEGRADAI